MSSPFLKLQPKKMAVICAGGIGDALITSIVAHHLKKKGIQVSLFSPHLHGFGSLLEEGIYLPYPSQWKETLMHFDAIFLQHDDTQRSKEIRELREQHFPIFLIYTNYHITKHGPLWEGYDYPVDPQKSMVKNTLCAIQELFQIPATAQNCLCIPKDWIHQKYKERVLIHPSSMNPEKNWPFSKFLKLAYQLKKRGRSPHFLLSPQEKAIFSSHIDSLDTKTLEDLAKVIYESGQLIGNDSGPAHLASYLSIPHTVICQGRQMPLWSPGWLAPNIVTPPKWMLNMKGLRLREKYWQKWISVRQVIHPKFPLAQ